jgi:FKBP-type peptidyl-prolyl cis-trans isomerase SlyD
MKIAKDTVVSLLYVLSEETGTPLEQNENGIPLAYLHGHQNILPALEEALTGLEEGAQKQVVLQPEDAYGHRRENTLQRVPVKHLLSKHKRLLPGTMVKVQTAKGAVDGTVVKVGKFMVDVDFNHPFAGKTLRFDITIKGIRPATADEIAHGHAHGDGGHHH